MADTYVITWEEDGNPNTIYVSVSEKAAVTIADALLAKAEIFSNVDVDKHETVVKGVAFRGR